MALAATRSVAIVSARVSDGEQSRVQLSVAPKSAFVGSTRALNVSQSVRASARNVLSVSAAADAGRPLWLPRSTPPPYLDGTIPGDYGFDPLGLGSDPEKLKWYVEAELIHGRWAMAAAAGIVIPPLIGVEEPWYSAGTLDYAIPALPLLAIQFPIMGFLETKRFAGFMETGACGFNDSYPFDPFLQASDDMKLKEVKNGRLAMVSVVGFIVQAVAMPGTDPISNLNAHIGSPVANNILGTLTN